MVRIENFYGDYKVSIKGLRNSVRARNVNEVLSAVRHYLARPSHCGMGKPRSCPFCRRNREELIGKKKAKH